ncbi:hypothetical protein [Chondromyces crocatus]|uniref:Lipoprotein n=1 Tax=Chondromyces crocatus TaxID=52 RepID=A0A0K1ESN7_CHOCO|nr:hypothetical protein [Chondromyces crocatus]AKT43881.1 uncharacterized protein CMC5_081180 [Chondromyces crocatus]
MSRARTSRWFALAALAVAPLGCALIAGLEDHQLRPAGPVVIADQPGALPHALLVDDTTAYWVTEASGRRGIWKVDKRGGTTVQLAVLQDPDAPTPASVEIGLAMDLEHVYWTQSQVQGNCDPSSPDYAPDRIMGVLKAGGALGPLVETCPHWQPHGVAADGQHVFASWRGNHRIDRIRKGTLSTSPLAENQYDPTEIVVDQTHVYWIVRRDDSSEAYIRSVSKNAPSTQPETLFSADSVAERRPNAIAVDDTTLFWVDDGRVRALHKPGTAGQGGGDGGQDAVDGIRDIASARGVFPAIAIDRDHVYWTEATEGRILRAPKRGVLVEPEVLAEGQSDPEAIAVDDEAIYWTNFVGGQLVRMNKPRP